MIVLRRSLIEMRMFDEAAFRLRGELIISLFSSPHLMGRLRASSGIVMGPCLMERCSPVLKKLWTMACERAFL